MSAIGSSSELTASDIEIGAVEIKNGTDDTRATIVTDNGAGATPTALVTGAQYNAVAPTYSTGDIAANQADANGNVKTTLATAVAGEDLANDVLKVENRFNGTMLAADGLVKTGVGVVHTLTFAQADAAPTAGTVIVYDNTAESGTVLFSHTFTTAVFNPFTVTLDMSFSIGLYVGFTTTADVNVSISFR